MDTKTVIQKCHELAKEQLNNYKRARPGSPPPPKRSKVLTLKELKSRPASLDELQATLIAFIELYNQQALAVQQELSNKQNRPWRASL